MITAEDVAKHLIDKLAEIYPKPATWKGISKALAAACPLGATTEQLEELAGKIIETRRQRTFPEPATLLMLVKAIPVASSPGDGVAKRRPGRRERVGGVDRVFAYGQDGALEREKALTEAETRAARFLRGTPLAARAIAERWAVGLLDFAIIEGRAPGYHEEEKIVAMVCANDAGVRDFVDAPNPVPARRNTPARFGMARIGAAVGDALRSFRAAMHETAARKLSDLSDPGADPGWSASE